MGRLEDVKDLCNDLDIDDEERVLLMVDIGN